MQKGRTMGIAVCRCPCADSRNQSSSYRNVQTMEDMEGEARTENKHNTKYLVTKRQKRVRSMGSGHVGAVGKVQEQIQY